MRGPPLCEGCVPGVPFGAQHVLKGTLETSATVRWHPAGWCLAGWHPAGWCLAGRGLAARPARS
jgi:hypothetical protein